jgi:hypothetical protein
LASNATRGATAVFGSGAILASVSTGPGTGHCHRDAHRGTLLDASGGTDAGYGQPGGRRGRRQQRISASMVKRSRRWD